MQCCDKRIKGGKAGRMHDCPKNAISQFSATVPDTQKSTNSCRETSFKKAKINAVLEEKQTGPGDVIYYLCFIINIHFNSIKRYPIGSKVVSFDLFSQIV